MNCPDCGAKSKVLNSHSPPKRRRECLACKARWTTVEVGRDEWERLRRVAEMVGLKFSYKTALTQELTK